MPVFKVTLTKEIEIFVEANDDDSLHKVMDSFVEEQDPNQELDDWSNDWMYQAYRTASATPTHKLELVASCVVAEGVMALVPIEEEE